ncbi:MAG: hypothetical protein CMM60_04770 [Rhodospirillaceae bacterium]|jgi:3-oxoacyl-[acyl-carrier protein] reductase|nr:hypothetical protein [Rhodospirillaceae bacterium]|tara:strand:- start:232 stop:987 length:756 start_codon:yes stop_codon:yes gene_type:complete
MFESLKNKRVLITGASSGIGRCTAELFAAHGAVCAIHFSENREGAQRTVDAIQSRCGSAELFQVDFSEWPSGSQLIRNVIKTMGGLDVLVNNAGALLGRIDFLKLDEGSWDLTYALNVKAPFFLSQEAFQHMQKNGGGRIINISSISAKYGGTAVSLHYGSAKAALEAVTRGLSRLGAEHDILVNAVRCGFIDSGFHEKIAWSREEIRERIERIPLGRPGKPMDAARMVLFLASEAGNHITGEIFTVSGGD